MVERWNVPSLNIKNDEAYQLAKELARRNDETVTTAVLIALKERLERQKPNPKAGLAQWLMELSQKTSPLMNDGTNLERNDGRALRS